MKNFIQRAGAARRSLVILFLFLYPLAAFAHKRGGEAIGFASGFEHPISGLDHILAMVAVGMWGAQLGAPAMWVLPVVFPMVMALGGMMGLMGIKLPGIELCIALSALALGFAVFREARPKLWIAAIIVGFFAIAHGHAHGTELPLGASGVLYSIGFVIATGLLHALGIGIGLVHRWPAGRIALRFAGAVVAMGGVFFLWKAISGEAGVRMHRPRLILFWLTLAITLIVAPSAQAHLMNTGFGPFYDGFDASLCDARGSAAGDRARLAGRATRSAPSVGRFSSPCQLPGWSVALPVYCSPRSSHCLVRRSS